MPRALKVFRTAIGFHDAYVAASTQKAALEAWGSTHDLFARKEAEIVTDPALIGEPLAHPGAVIKRLRGTADEQLAALPATKARRADGKAKERTKPDAPRPDRAELNAAEARLQTVEQKHEAERDAIAAEEAKLAERRRTLERAQDAELAKLGAARDRARAAYDKAMEAWRA